MEPKLTGIISAQTGFVKNAANDLISCTTAGIGGKVEGKYYEIMAEGGYGSALYGKVEGGAKIPFGESNFGLKTTIGGQYTQATKSKDYYNSKFEDGANSPTWKANDARGYGQVALTYNNETVEVGLGVRGGIKTSTQPSLDGITLADVGETRGTEYAGRTTKTFVEPMANVGVNLGKGWKIALQAAPSQSSLGLSLNF